MSSLPPLTKRQRQILDFYAQYIEREGLSPTLEEVASAFGLNKVTVFGHVAELERKGVLERHQPGISRGIRIAGAPGDAGAEDAGERNAGEGRVLPIRGRVAAGQPIEAIEDLDVLDWNDLVPRHAGVYALRVQGDSMIEDGIRDGDLVLIEPRNQAQAGETVVAVVPGEEATLKRFYPMPDGVRLEPANATLEPIFAPSVDIRGVLVGVVRNLRR